MVYITFKPKLGDCWNFMVCTTHKTEYPKATNVTPSEQLHTFTEIKIKKIKVSRFEHGMAKVLLQFVYMLLFWWRTTYNDQ